MPDCICLNPKCPSPGNPQEALTCQACGHTLAIRKRYRAFKRLGQGGFGSTFLARDQDLPAKPWRVIKQLRPVENSPQIAQLALELFNREAEVLEKLGQHSQIPNLFAHFEEEGNFYLVQEFVQGQTLSHEVHKNGPMSEEQARQVMQEVLLILSYVHSQNTVHRDIKPANLIRRKDDQRLVLIDFGAVKELKPTKEPNPQIEMTAIRSLGFSPPEQVAGQAVGPSSDLYALASTCINLMTMESPTKFLDPNTNRWDWVNVLNLTPEFDRILHKMLNQAINERYASATEVLRALQGVADDKRASQISIANPIIGSAIRGNQRFRAQDSVTGFTPVTPPPPVASLIGNPGTTFSGISKPSAPRIPSLAGQDLRDRSFANQNLVGRDFRKSDIRGTDLSGTNLQKADLREVVFNMPKPRFLQILGWVFGGAKTIGGILAGLVGLLGSTIVTGVAVWLITHVVWLSLLGGVVGAGIAWSVLWQMTGRKSFGTYHEESHKRYTSFRKADLRGAQMDEKLRTFARRQGALVD